MKKLILFMLAGMFMVTASASTYVSNGGVQQVGRIIPSWAGDRVSFTGTKNPTACSSIYYRLDKTYAGFKENFSILLLAQANDSNITVITFGCDVNGAAVVKSIYLD